jgi:hypothetical protein
MHRADTGSFDAGLKRQTSAASTELVRPSGLTHARSFTHLRYVFAGAGG